MHYCGNLWNPNYWVLLDRLKCATPSGKAQNVFANDIQRLYDIANRLASLEQTKSQLDNFYGRSSICCWRIKDVLGGWVIGQDQEEAVQILCGDDPPSYASRLWKC